jgi:hypothetical protein
VDFTTLYGVISTLDEAYPQSDQRPRMTTIPRRGYMGA